MANFNNIKNEIDQNVNTNGQQAITGAILNETLKDMLDSVDTEKQDTLISGTNIKTVNGNSLLGSGDIQISGGGSGSYTEGIAIDIDSNNRINVVPEDLPFYLAGTGLYTPVIAGRDRLAVDYDSIPSQISGNGLRGDGNGNLEVVPSEIAGNGLADSGDGKLQVDFTETQAKLVGGNGIDITDLSGNILSVDYDQVQAKLTAGSGISIDSGNVISATGGGSSPSYTAGDGIDITNDEISIDYNDFLDKNLWVSGLAATDPSGMTGVFAFSSDGSSTAHLDAFDGGHASLTLSQIASGTTTEAQYGTTGISVGNGNNHTISFPSISQDDTFALASDLSGKQDTLTAGTGISISGNVISATGGGSSPTYTAGDGIDITNDVISVDSSDLAGTGLNVDINGALEVDTTVIQEKLSAGTGISISGNVISATGGGGSGLWTSGTGVDSLMAPGTADDIDYVDPEDPSQGINNQSESSGTRSIATGSFTHATGDFSAAFGWNTSASGTNSFTSGMNSNAYSTNAAAFGANGSAFGEDSFIAGDGNTANGYASAAFGYYTATYSSNDFSAGSFVHTSGFGQGSEAAFGTYNYTTYDPNESYLFTIGNGEQQSIYHEYGTSTWEPNPDDPESTESWWEYNEVRKNAVDVKYSGDIYIQDIGGYDGTNSPNATRLQDVISGKQDLLTAGTGISISGNVISATGGGGTTYTAGDGIDITNDVISVDSSDLAGTGLNVDINGALEVDTTTIQEKLTAGSNIQISNGVISATDTNTTYSAGSGLNLNGTTFSADTSTIQEKLVSGTNIKTVNGNSLLGSGDLVISGGGGSGFWKNGTGTNSLIQFGMTGTEGQDYEASGSLSIITGSSNKATNSNSAAFGYNNTASGDSSVVFGSSNTASGYASAAFGSASIASGFASAAFGSGEASGRESAAFDESFARGDYSVAFNGGNANEDYSAAFCGGVANGDYSAAIGHGVFAENESEIALGKYNRNNVLGATTAEKTHFTIGNGTSGNLSNSLEIKQNNDLYIYGVGGYTGANSAASDTLQDVISGKQDTLVSGTSIKTINGNSILGSGDLVISGGSGSYLPLTGGTLQASPGSAETLLDISAPDTTSAVSISADTLDSKLALSADSTDASIQNGDTYTTVFSNTGEISLSVKDSTPTTYTLVLPQKNDTLATLSDIQGGGSYTAGTGISISNNVISNTAPDSGLWLAGSGSNSIKSSTATSANSGGLAIGYHTEAGPEAVALGYLAKARCTGSVAIGSGAVAGNSIGSTGYYAFATGYNAVAEGNYSVAIGYNAYARVADEYTIGQNNKYYNSNNANEKVLFSVGNGSSSYSRANALEFKQNNDLYIHGVGGFDGTNASSADTLQEVISSKAGQYSYTDANIAYAIGIGTSGTPLNALAITSSGDIYVNGLGNYTGTSISGATSLQTLLSSLNNNNNNNNNESNPEDVINDGGDNNGDGEGSWD